MRRAVQKRGLVSLGFLTLVLLAVPAAASTFIAMDTGELVAGSDAVIEGQVIRVESSWDATGSVIVSEAVIEVSEAVVGASARRVRVQTFGGKVDDYEVVAHGFPRFASGDRVLLFVNRREAADRSLRVTGHQLGHYRIVERDGTRMAEPTLEEGVNLVGRGQQQAAPPQALSLADLKAQVRSLAAGNGTR